MDLRIIQKGGTAREGRKEKQGKRHRRKRMLKR